MATTHPVPLSMNWSGVGVAWQIGSGSATTTTIAEVMSIEIGIQAAQESFYGDARRFARLVKNTAETRTVSITSGNISALLAIPTNATGTVTFTLNNADNAAATGSITFTLINAVRISQAPSGANNKFAMNTITFAAYGDDTDSDPLSYVVNP